MGGLAFDDGLLMPVYGDVQPDVSTAPALVTQSLTMPLLASPLVEKLEPFVV